MNGNIRIGVGGWTFPPWRGSFYPKGLAQARELEFMSRKLTSIEINGTYRSSQKPATFKKWYDETPDGFVFSVKGPMFATNRKVLPEAAPSIEKFFESGVTNLKEKLGPINWQFMGHKQFDPDDFGPWLELLPKSVDGVELRHAVEVRNDSFACPEFIEMARSHNVAIVISVHPKYPQIADLTAPFVYIRLQTAGENESAGYSDDELDLVATAAGQWSAGKAPREHLTYAADPAAGDGAPRDVFIYFISGDKVKNPAAAQALIERV